MWVAWTLARWPDSQYLYISYSKSLAAKHTEFIRRVISCPSYRDLFNVHIRPDSRAKEFFQTTAGGSIRAFGSSGAITGQDAGLPNLDRFSGAIILDDMHKPDEVHSDLIRKGVIENYRETILQRPRSPNVPIIFIGQRLHEDDLPAYMLSGEDERTYKPVIIKALDDAGNALYPSLNSLQSLKEKQDKNPYVFASQYQQNPIPAGGALYKERDFLQLDIEPKILCTFITADTAETDKSYNDATVFSFWGIYKIVEAEQETGQIALHWLDCQETRVEPKELKDAFLSFYAECMLHPVKPLIAAIEKKSTGVTLASTLGDMRGLSIRDIKRTKASGSKTARFLEMQPIIASKLVTFTEDASHYRLCVDHLMKITANNTHRHDDICDTLYDAVKIALIDKTIYFERPADKSKDILKSLASSMNERTRAMNKAANYDSGRYN
jgi:predicted phage terminase large subunit-like protein